MAPGCVAPELMQTARLRHARRSSNRWSSGTPSSDICSIRKMAWQRAAMTLGGIAIGSPSLYVRPWVECGLVAWRRSGWLEASTTSSTHLVWTTAWSAEAIVQSAWKSVPLVLCFDLALPLRFLCFATSDHRIFRRALWSWRDPCEEYWSITMRPTA